MLLAGRQIRAARVLIGMSQDKLSELTGLTVQGIRKIEEGISQPREGTLSDISRVFAEHGVEFTENSGVRLKPQAIEVFSGHEGFCRFYDLLYADLSLHGGMICACGVDEELFVKHHGEQAEPHIARMAALAATRKDISMRVLIREGDYNYAVRDYIAYRWMKAADFGATCFYVFNDFLALISFSAVPAPNVILIKSSAHADSYRQQFRNLWEGAQIPPAKGTA